MLLWLESVSPGRKGQGTDGGEGRAWMMQEGWAHGLAALLKSW